MSWVFDCNLYPSFANWSYIHIHIQAFPVLLLQFDKNMLIKKHCMEHITLAKQRQHNSYLPT